MGAPGKKVRFPEDDQLVILLKEVENREDWTESEREALFFSKQDYANSRRSTKLVTLHSEKKGYSIHLKDAFSEKSEDAQEHLNQWCLHGHEHRGLERLTCKSHGEHRHEEQFRAVMAVLQTQDELLTKGKDVDPQKLRKVSYKATRAARHFARMIAKADMYAVENEALVELDDESMTTTTVTSASSVVVTDDEISLPRIDPLRDSMHGQGQGKRFYRFNFMNRTRNKRKEAVPVSPHKDR
ncbi:hypothetical protein FisN_22Hh142 [Fistulifera solaris]|jgi:hypothetical protein|uniref:Uncharacterized protein n=1 Tax=Fistulifera solaris TaxID=1519565 RepID=A0A1Z5JQE9_FISSO|nr:hypothetical protein FisN_22Hh142 [Fistulifera solaris]|eukprot:GAX16001.1 hypothetical protein FisN_22Hh142 [Fistulifera solaris]